MKPLQLTGEIKATAKQLGFASVGFCPAVEPQGFSRLLEWIQHGYAGDMHYISNRAEAYAHPRSVLDGARSVVMLTVDYRTSEPTRPQPGQGRVSRYAWGTADYHDVIHSRLKQLVAKLDQLVPGCKARGVVDTAPLLERDFAALAGLGWIGKNTLLLNRQQGSLFFLAALVTDVELAYDLHHETDHCGSCTACLDACPTGAFPQPYVLDATRCVSYLTIELRQPIPTELRHGMGNWLFGCDICQDVCPWNNRAPQATEPAFRPAADHDPVELIELLSLDDDHFRQRFRNTPMWRAKRRGLLRNAATVLGNQRCAAATPQLIACLDDDEPLVRGGCAWALGQIGNSEAAHGLRQRLPIEQEDEVTSEIKAAIAACG